MKTRPQVIAHRGVSGEAPENTLAAYRKALAIGVDGVELDVHLSADGIPVVIHDPRLERTTTGRGLVKDHTVAALKRLDAGRWFGEAFAGERIPTLAEALDLLRPVRVIVELKNGPIYYPGIAAAVAAVVREVGHTRITVSSFDHPVLLDLRAAAPEIPTAVLLAARPIDPVRPARDADARYLHLQWAFVTREVVEVAHAAGLAVEAWTVDEPEQMRGLLATGADGIMSNHPARLQVLVAGWPDAGDSW
ncbi:MAG: glycerophosphodiester phosphodiesterase family protein [Armatimonadota bacterium]|nr:glycerophosphodiester phosphodiesterase family protein [Armatimonadota bacterium]